MTIELRLPDDQQADPNNWRSYKPTVDIQFNYDHPPTTPTNLSVQYKPSFFPAQYLE